MTAPACASCGTPNEADARFCEGCGTALERSCGNCGVAVSATARFCKGCGAPLDGGAGPVAAGPTRKTVTVMFADLAGSTAFEEAVDAETAREVIGRYHDLLRSTAQRHRAGVTKYIGDGFMGVWGVPEVGADDAEHAVEAALELQESFIGLASQVADVHGVNLALRVAVNTGEVVVGANDADLVGDALNVGARLESECPHGQVVVGEETWRSTRGRYRYDPMGRMQVKGRSSPVAVYQWSGRSTEASDSIAFVGRADELRRIQAVFDEAVDNAAARLITIIGDPGVGKSRLAAEFISAHPDARIVRANCAVEGTPALTPIVELLRSRDIEADVPAGTPERERIVRALTGMAAGIAGSVEETFWALRRFAEILAAERPLIIVFDDIHWADSLLLDFIEHLAEWARGVPVLMIGLARPEIRETRPELVAVGGCVTEAVRLSGLEPSATAELAAQVLGSEQLPVELLGRLPSSTGGNPLFVRELVGMLVHDGVLVPRPDGWRLTVDVDAIAIPPTIQALLASRLERLNAADRRVLEVASVVGTDFSPAAVCALTGLGRAETQAALDRLRRHDLAQPTGTYSGDEPVWRFHHVLIRDVAYRRLLKSDRAELHETLADWAPGDGARPALQSDEMIARHLEAAVGYRRDLGMRDEHTTELALRSARGYLASARRALDRDELLSAGTQAARGAAIATGDATLKAELLLIGCEAFLSAGDVAAGAPLVDELEHVAGESLAPWAICYRCQFIAYTDPSRLPEADERLQGAIDEFSQREDTAGLAKAHRVRASARGRLGRIGDSEIDLFEALIAARQCGDHRQITAALGAAPNAALWGPSPAPKAGGRCLDVVRMQRMTTAAPSLEATSLRCLAVLELLRGRADKARTMLGDARQVVADLGLRHGLMETELFAGIIEMMVGDPVSAEPHFRTALEGLDALGVGADAGQAAALLARSVLAQGRVDEADRYAAESERIAGHNLKTAIAWRAVRAEILSARGEHEAAIANAREAVAVAAQTDLVLDHADACLALSRVLAVAGDAPTAARARSDAEALYRAKDAVFMVGRAEQPVTVVTTPAPTQVAQSSRLVVRNRASDLAEEGWRGLQAHDIEAVAATYSDQSVYDDRRSIGGGPLAGLGWSRRAAERAIADYPHAEWQTLAVRGNTLALLSGHLWDDAGNESVTLNVFELAADGLIGYHGRFDGDDFQGAYREMESRYYRREGAALAENGHAASAWVEAMWRCDVEAARRISWPHFRWLASPSALKPAERSIDEFFDWQIERARQLSAMQKWVATTHWISPSCCVALSEIQGVGADGEEYDWSRIYAAEYRDGLAVSVREFDVDDEDAAFTYAESLVAHTPRRLVVANAASRVGDRAFKSLQANDADAVNDLFSADIVYEDRRPVAGALITGIDYLIETVAALLTQYDHFTSHTLAVRGDRHCLAWSRWSDDAGNESSNLHVIELGDDGLIARYLYCADDDFEGAYREMESWYYAGEGAAYADSGRIQSAFVAALDHLDVAAARQLCRPEFRWSSPTKALGAPVRTIDEVVSWWRGRAGQVDSLRNWASAITWISPEIAVSNGEARGISRDGADYSWSGIFVTAFRGGQLELVYGFELEDEDAAFAYADSLVKQRDSRLVAANAASRALDKAFAALQANDPSTVTGLFSAAIVYEDRRPLAGALQTGVDYLNDVIPALLSQYDHFELHILAVRGDRLCLAWSRWSDPAGNEASNLHVTELREDGLIARLLYFVEDDFWSAYRDLENRYYAGEGTRYADSGRASADWAISVSTGDIEGARRASHPEFRWYATPSALKDAERTVDDMFRWWEERGRQVASQRHWVPALDWLSPDCAVGRGEIAAVGPDGEQYSWHFIYVAECRDGLLATVHEFEDEEHAFAYAESVITPKPSRLSLSNASSDVAHEVFAALQAGDLDTVASTYADNYRHADHRRFSGGPITDRASARAAWERIAALYNRFEIHIVAVRGERLHLLRYRWSDDSGNESTGFVLTETSEEGRFVFQDRFDEDDFDTAYAELDRRYFAGEGAPYAEEGLPLVENAHAENRGDLDSAFRIFSAPGLRVESRSRSVFPARSAAELRDSVEQLGAMVTSYRVWSPVTCWLSKNWIVLRHDREAVGRDGEKFYWSRLYAGETHGGRFTSLCEFDVDDEVAAFAYAEERMRATPIRLAVSNRACAVARDFVAALHSGDIDAAAAVYSDQVVYDDRRRLGGDPINGGSAVRDAIERFTQNYNRFELSTTAVRGDLLQLAHHRWSDDAGNQAAGYIVAEIAPDGKVIYDGRFDEDDFDTAYRELERRYLAAEGAAFATTGWTLVTFLEAMNVLDVEAARRVCQPTCRWLSPPSTLTTQERSLDEYFRWLDERARQVSSVNNFFSAIHWVSPTCYVGRGDVLAVGADGEEYTWARIYVGEFSNGLMSSVHQFADEDAAFAYADECVRITAARLALSNRATDVGILILAAMRAHDLDGTARHWADQFVYDDRRRYSGDPLNDRTGMRLAMQRIFKQYSRFESRVLAVRGSSLNLASHCWSDDNGNRSSSIILAEVDEDDRIIYEGRFDEDDFDAAYQAMENRYYAGEGAEFAESGNTSTQVVLASNAGDLDRVFGELMAPDMRVDSRSGSIFPDRTTEEFRDSVKLFQAMVSSSRIWLSAIQWLSPNCAVARQEREAVGKEGEKYTWTRIYVCEFEDGLGTALCDFDVEFEEQAFAYAEERMRANASRLAVTNRASETGSALIADLNAKDIDGALAHLSEQVVYTDRRPIGGALVTDFASMRLGVETACRQYSKFEGGPLAVRGDNIGLGWARFSDERGNLTEAFELIEVGDDGRIVFHATFDEADFESARRELESRYHSGEGAAFSEYADFNTAYITAMNRGDFDTMFNEMAWPDLRVENRSRSVFPDRSAEDLRRSFEELYAMLGSVRSWFSVVHWLSPTINVGRLEREGLGRDGERYAWTRILVNQYRDGRLASICEFDAGDEDAALAYAEELAAQT